MPRRPARSRISRLPSGHKMLKPQSLPEIRCVFSFFKSTVGKEEKRKEIAFLSHVADMMDSRQAHSRAQELIKSEDLLRIMGAFF